MHQQPTAVALLYTSKIEERDRKKIGGERCNLQFSSESEYLKIQIEMSHSGWEEEW